MIEAVLDGIMGVAALIMMLLYSPKLAAGKAVELRAVVAIGGE